MSRKGPGKSYRKGLSTVELFRMFPDDRAAEKWFIRARWPNGVHCPDCGSLDVRDRPSRKPQPFRCGDCRKDFSVKTGSVMHGSKLGLQTWAIAIYLMSTSLKGVSSMKLHRELGITQRAAWHLGHRIRLAFERPTGLFEGPVEADETFVGGKKKGTRRAGIKTPVMGVKDRATKQVRAQPTILDKKTQERFVLESIVEGAKVYSDGGAGYMDIPTNEWVCHSRGEYVRGVSG